MKPNRQDLKLTKRQAGRLGGLIGGLSRSPAKLLAARTNGKLGGRPSSPEVRLREAVTGSDEEGRKRWKEIRKSLKTLQAEGKLGGRPRLSTLATPPRPLPA